MLCIQLVYIYIYIYIPQLEGLLEVDTSIMDLRKRTFSFSLGYLNFRLPAAAKTELDCTHADWITVWGGRRRSGGGRGRGRGGGRGRERERESERCYPVHPGCPN